MQTLGRYNGSSEPGGAVWEAREPTRLRTADVFYSMFASSDMILTRVGDVPCAESSTRLDVVSKDCRHWDDTTAVLNGAIL